MGVPPWPWKPPNLWLAVFFFSRISDDHDEVGTRVSWGSWTPSSRSSWDDFSRWGCPMQNPNIQIPSCSTSILPCPMVSQYMAIIGGSPKRMVYS